MIGVTLWWVYLAPQNIPGAIVLTFGSKILLFCIVLWWSIKEFCEWRVVDNKCILRLSCFQASTRYSSWLPGYHETVGTLQTTPLMTWRVLCWQLCMKSSDPTRIMLCKAYLLQYHVIALCLKWWFNWHRKIHVLFVDGWEVGCLKAPFLLYFPREIF